MTRKQQKLYRTVESHITIVLRNYVYVRTTLESSRFGRLRTEAGQGGTFSFSGPGDMRAWKMDVEKSASAVDKTLRLNGGRHVGGVWHSETLQVLGDKLVIGMPWGDLASLHARNLGCVTMDMDEVRGAFQGVVSAMYVQLWEIPGAHNRSTDDPNFRERCGNREIGLACALVAAQEAA